MGSKDKSHPAAHQRYIKALRDQSEKTTGHSPTDSEQREIEANAETIAQRYQRNQTKKD